MPQSIAQPQPSVISVAWWALGTVVCVLPVCAALWTPNRDAAFYPAVVCGAVIGGVAGTLTHRRWLGRIPPSLLVAVIYPMALVGAVAFESRDEMTRATSIAAWILVGGSVSAIAVLVRVVSARPGSSFRRLSIVWYSLGVALLFVMGVGIVFLPLAVSYGLAAGHFAEDSAQQPNVV